MKEDNLAALKAERDAADREYNEALTRLDRAIQQLPATFPHPPPGLDEHQITPLNTLWKIDAPPPAETSKTSKPFGRLARKFVVAVRRAVAPLFEQQQAFNSAVVDHLNRNVPVARQTRESIAATLTVLHDTITELVRFQSLLVVFLQQITPYVDTRDRDVAGLLRGLSGAINAVADEVMRKSEALLARDMRRANELASVEQQVAALRAQIDAVARELSPPSR